VASTFNWALDQSFAFLSTIIIISAILPQLLIVALVVLAGFYWLSISYIATTRDLRRLEANARSPLYSAFGELLAGLPIVRAFAAEERFQAECLERIDAFARMDYW
jgi:ABC-type multidrug transport system fused ATPase/permease subunit